MAAAILGFVMAGTVTGRLTGITTHAYAIPVEDSGTWAQETLNRAQLIKQLEELKNTVELMQKQYDAIAGVASSVSSTSAMAQLKQTMGALLPDVRVPILEDGFRPDFSSVKKSIDSAKKLYFMLPEGGTFGAETISSPDYNQLIIQRREEMLKYSVIDSFALANTAKQNLKRTTDVSDALIVEANTAPDVMSVLRVQVKAMSHILSELAAIRALSAQRLEMEANTTVRDLPTTSAPSGTWTPPTFKTPQ